MRSLRNMTLRMALTTTLTAPSGVTSIAGENAYAMKLKTSPSAKKKIPTHQYALLKMDAFCSADCTVSMSPFFCSTSDVPMKSPDVTASPMPTPSNHGSRIIFVFLLRNSSHLLLPSHNFNVPPYNTSIQYSCTQ